MRRVQEDDIYLKLLRIHADWSILLVIELF